MPVYENVANQKISAGPTISMITICFPRDARTFSVGCQNFMLIVRARKCNQAVSISCRIEPSLGGAFDFFLTVFSTNKTCFVAKKYCHKTILLKSTTAHSTSTWKEKRALASLSSSSSLADIARIAPVLASIVKRDLIASVGSCML